MSASQNPHRIPILDADLVRILKGSSKRKNAWGVPPPEIHASPFSKDAGAKIVVATMSPQSVTGHLTPQN